MAGAESVELFPPELVAEPVGRELDVLIGQDVVLVQIALEAAARRDADRQQILLATTSAFSASP